MWMSVGFAVSSVFHRDDEGLQLFQRFSEAAPNYDASSCAKMYAEGDGRLTLGSIIHWLREDRPDVAEEIVKQLHLDNNHGKRKAESTPSNYFLGLSEVGESSKKSRTARDSENDRDHEMKDEANTTRADAHDSENDRDRKMKTPVLGWSSKPKRGQLPKEVNRDSKNTQGTNVWLIKKLMYDGEVGWAEVIVLYLHQTVKVVDRKTGRAYVWNANTSLWQDTLSDGVLPEVSNILSGHFDSMSEHLQAHITRHRGKKSRSSGMIQRKLTGCGVSPSHGKPGKE